MFKFCFVREGTQGPLLTFSLILCALSLWLNRVFDSTKPLLPPYLLPPPTYPPIPHTPVTHPSLRAPIYVYILYLTYIQSVPIATYICICIHTQVYVRIYVCIYVYIRTHTHTDSLSLSLSLSVSLSLSLSLSLMIASFGMIGLLKKQRGHL
jgi:hypothetical protein